VATHFSRLLQHAWFTVGLFLFPGHHTGIVVIHLTNIFLTVMKFHRSSLSLQKRVTESYPDNNYQIMPNTRMYSKVSELAAWSENCKWYSSVPLGAVISVFCGLV
jgi:hypothetical protein